MRFFLKYFFPVFCLLNEFSFCPVKKVQKRHSSNGPKIQRRIIKFCKKHPLWSKVFASFAVGSGLLFGTFKIVDYFNQRIKGHPNPPALDYLATPKHCCCETNLQTFLKKADVSEQVKKLVGSVKVTSHKAGDEQWLDKAFSLPGKARVEQDIFKLLYQQENDFSDMMNCSLGQIDELLKTFEANQKPATAVKKQFFIVRGMPVGSLSKTYLGRTNAILQVASRCHFLEAEPHPNLDVVQQYAAMPYQGQQASIASAICSIKRHVAVYSNIVSNIVSGFAANAFLVEKYGYFSVQNFLASDFDTSRHKLKFLLQWVLCEGSNALQLNVFSSCPFPYQANSIHDNFVMTMYEMIVKVAKLRSLLDPSKVVNLHLTLLGGGVYGYPASLYPECLDLLKNLIQGWNINLFVHAYSDDDFAKIQSKVGPTDFTVLSKAAFEMVLNDAQLQQP